MEISCWNSNKILRNSFLDGVKLMNQVISKIDKSVIVLCNNVENRFYRILLFKNNMLVFTFL